MNAKHSQVASSHWPTSHCCLYLDKYFSHLPGFKIKTLPKRIQLSEYRPRAPTTPLKDGFTLGSKTKEIPKLSDPIDQEKSVLGPSYEVL